MARCLRRSSAIGEDTAFSFAGQYATYLNLSQRELVDAYRRVVASKFTPQAIYYLLSHSLLESDTPMAAGCIGMVDARGFGGVALAPSRESLVGGDLDEHGLRLSAGARGARVIESVPQSGPAGHGAEGVHVVAAVQQLPEAVGAGPGEARAQHEQQPAGGKDKGQAENDQPPVDLHDLMP